MWCKPTARAVSNEPSQCNLLLRWMSSGFLRLAAVLTFKVTVDETESGTITVTPPVSGHLKFWKDDGKSEAFEEWEVSAGGSGSNVGSTVEEERTVYLEGYEHSASVKEEVFTASYSGYSVGDPPADLAEKSTVYHADLSIDSDNDGTITDDDDKIEYSEKVDAETGLVPPGKYVLVNDGDADGDGILDYTDGFSYEGGDDAQIDAGGVAFVSLELHLPAPVDMSSGTVKFIYEGADPADGGLRSGSGTEADPYAYNQPAGNRIRIWTKDGGEARNKADLSAGGDYVKADVAYALSSLATGESVTLYVEGVGSGGGEGSIAVEVDVGGENAGFVVTDKVRYTLLKVDLAVDADRSGTEFDPGIQFGGSDQTTEDEPYYFWVNNDRDSGSDDEAQDNEPISGQEDYWSAAILNSRGMEDLSRIWIDVDGIADQLKDGSLRLGLEWKNVIGDPKIKLYKAVEVDGGMKYLFDENVADLQKEVANRSAIQFNTGNYGGPPDEFFVNKNEPVYFETSFWDDLPGDEIEHFLFEGAGEGKGELVFVLQSATGGAYQDIEMSMSGVWFDLKDIKKMYQHFTVATPDNTFMGEEVMDPATSASEINSVSKSDLDEMGFEDDYILFVHGWRMKAWERRYFAETAFKRLYWLRFKGRFGTFSWPTEWTSRPWGTAITDSENYMRSDHKARLSGQGLSETMNNLMATYAGQMSVFAHSMGNVVVSEALRLGGQAKTFVACQAASVARAYDANGPERLTTGRLFDALTVAMLADVGITGGNIFLDELDAHPDVFANYPPTGEVYYKGIRPNAIQIVNHHNRLDDALAWWLAGQAKKPNGDYSYHASSNRWYRDDGIWPVANLVELQFSADTYEIFARAAEPDSVPLGASVANGFATGGEVNGNRNLQALHDFQDGNEDHSAQFRSTIQRRWDYWNGLMADFGIFP